jgi:hypothetical protein
MSASSSPELPQEDSTEPGVLSDFVPPSLTLNIPRTTPDWRTPIVLATVGFLFQGAVMVVNALAVYRWGWLRSGHTVASYGYPTWAAGTAAITIGAYVCGWVVESSSQKRAITAHGSPGSSSNTGQDQLRIIFLQRKISEQNILAYAIESILPGGAMKVSRRLWPPTSERDPLMSTAARTRGTIQRELSVFLGAGLMLAGFVSQNIGTRVLHFSAGLLQLGVTLILTLLRAWLRRNVGVSLEDVAAVRKLRSGFETCDLATHLTKYDCYLASTSDEGYFDLDAGDEIYNMSNFKNKLSKLKLRLKTTDDRDYRYILNSVLKTQSVIAQYELDADHVVKAAANCYKAMEEIFKMILPGVGNENHNILDPFLYMVITGKGQDSLEEETAPTKGYLPLYRLGFPPDKSTYGVRFLQAVISLTRYAHADFTGLVWKGKIFRILGHCTHDDLEAYTLLLRAWIDPYQATRIWNYGYEYPTVGVRQIRASTEPEKDVDFLDPRNSRIFGLPFSYEFQKDISSVVYERNGNSKVKYTSSNERDE